MDKNSVFFPGAVAGSCLFLLVNGPRSESWIAAAKAAAGSDTYAQLNLLGDVFERVRADYVEKPDDAKLVEAAVNGMVSSPDPHPPYINNSHFLDLQHHPTDSFR